MRICRTPGAKSVYNRSVRPIIVLAALALVGGAAPKARPPHSETLIHAASPHALGCVPSDAEKSYILQVLAQLNDYRILNGLQPLVHDITLERAMVGHCHHMPQHGFFAHTHSFATEPESQDWVLRAQANGGGFTSYGENIAVGYTTPTEVMDGWKGSPGHNANMLNASWTRVGVGYYTTGDYWGQLFGTGSAVQPDSNTPTVATPAAASPNPVTGTSTNLSVLGFDDGGESALTYTWSATTAPGSVSFSANGTNAAKNTVATVGAAGSYTFRVVVRDSMGLTVLDTVSVTVNTTPTTVGVTPATVSVGVGGTQQFSGQVRDQFGNAMAAPISWSVSGGGSIDSAGLFTAGGTPGGPHTVTATSGPASGTASVTVLSSPPVVTTIQVNPASAAVERYESVQFSAVAYDQAANPLFTQPAFTWSVSGGGTIDSTGLFSAGAGAGVFTVTASSGGVQGTASVTVLEKEEKKRCGAVGAEALLGLAVLYLSRKRRSAS